MVPEGWKRVQTQAFGTHVGPFYHADEPEPLHYGFVADARHANKRGVVHGGMLATAFDVALGQVAWAAAGQHPSATVQLTIQYIGALNLGEFATIQCEVVRATRSLIFLRGTMTVQTRIVATADGIWKILTWRGAPFVPPPPMA